MEIVNVNYLGSNPEFQEYNNKDISLINYNVISRNFGNGDDYIEYFIYDNEIVKKPKKKTERLFKILKKDTQGYKLYKGNPYWPTGVVEGGYTWQTPSE